MRLKLILSLLLATSLVATSCSNNKKKEEPLKQAESGQQDQVLEDADFIVDADDSDFLLEEEGQTASSNSEDSLLQEEMSQDQQGSQDSMQQESIKTEEQGALLASEEVEKAQDGQGQMVESQSTKPMISKSSQGVKEYTVQEGDTLLWIAFKIYGDYAKWRHISNMNDGVVEPQAGQVLSYEAPEEEFTWDPKGLPHLVKKGETLGTISSQHYGTPKRWEDIYENNQPMIKDPDLIFAGFTLYYVPDEQRDVASDVSMTDGEKK